MRKSDKNECSILNTPAARGVWENLSLASSFLTVVAGSVIAESRLPERRPAASFRDLSSSFLWASCSCQAAWAWSGAWEAVRWNLRILEHDPQIARTYRTYGTKSMSLRYQGLVELIEPRERSSSTEPQVRTSSNKGLPQKRSSGQSRDPPWNHHRARLADHILNKQKLRNQNLELTSPILQCV